MRPRYAVRMQRACLAVCAVVLVALAGRRASAQSVPPAASPPPAPCSAALRSALDFWAGDWVVTNATTRAPIGTNRIERVSGGYAFVERWDGSSPGDEGTSLFYLDPRACTWRQTWVDAQPDVPGGLKHKELVAMLPGGGLRFQGVYPGRRFPFVLDRTTLTPEANGTLRQVIELSGNGGQTWAVGFDAIYARR